MKVGSHLEKLDIFGLLTMDDKIFSRSGNLLESTDRCVWQFGYDLVSFFVHPGGGVV